MTDRQPLTPKAMTWADEVRAFLARHDMTQEAFARLVGVSFTTVSRWLNGHKQPSPLAERAARDAMKRQDRRLMAEEGPSVDTIGTN